MSFEQMEGHLAEYEGKQISVVIPIRGTVHFSYYGNLAINHDWANHSIYYSIRLHPDSDINFQAQDVEKIIPKPNSELDATIILKSEEERYKLHHA